MESNSFTYFLLAIAVSPLLFIILRIFFKKKSAIQNGTEVDLPDVCGPDGEKILVSVGPERNPLPKPNDEIQVIKQSPDTARNECGHDGPTWYQLDAYGVSTTKIDDRKICPDCLMSYIRTHATRCSLCGLPIFPGDGVALYHESSGGLKYRGVASRVGDSCVGCLRWNCCPSGGFFAGHWTDDGFRSAFPDEDTAATQAMKTGRTVVTSI